MLEQRGRGAGTGVASRIDSRIGLWTSTSARTASEARVDDETTSGASDANATSPARSPSTRRTRDATWIVTPATDHG